MGPDMLRAIALVAALAGACILLGSVLRDLRRPRRRADPQADLVALYYVVIVAGCGATVLLMLLTLMTVPAAVAISALPFAMGLIAAASIRFVPGTHPVWHRLAARLKSAP